MYVERERKRGISKALIKSYGVLEAYEMYGQFMGYPYSKLCTVCGSKIYDYSEWHDTGYETEECQNGCWRRETYGMTHELETKGFYFRGKYDSLVMDEFEKQIKINSLIAKQKRKLFWKKKRSQRKNA